MTRRLRIGHLYADFMNVYGDRGNVLALLYRCRARGIEADVATAAAGERFDPSAFDLLLMGGGQDGEQRRVADDLQLHGEAIRAAVADGMPVLAVCGGYQLFGRRYVDDQGNVLPGIAVFDLETRHPGTRANRCVGNVVVDTPLGEVVGFENHGGRTFLAPGQEPFGRVRRGLGNNAKDGTEGARRGNAIGTYLHGSLLPKNPAVTDFLIRRALERREGRAVDLEPLEDTAERAAHARAVALAMRKR